MAARVSNVYQIIRARLFDGATNSAMFMPRLVLNPARLLLIVSLCSAGVGGTEAASITLNPVQDTFISEAIGTPNGTGMDMVIGTQGAAAGFAKNRGLIQFDLSLLPPGAVVLSATLRLTVTRVPFTPANSDFHLHRMILPWDDLESSWTLRLDPDENWGTPGGQEDTDFSATASGSARVAGGGDYTFESTPELVGDVNAWLTNSAANHGWLVKTEDESVGFTARRFASREGLSGVPVLEVQFEAPEPPRISSSEIVGGQFCLRFTARQGKSYVVERRDKVDSGTWTAITNLPPAAATEEIVICDPLGTETGFYRVGER